MPLNRAFLGRVIHSAEPLEVTAGDIRRFATAIGDHNLAYHDSATARSLGYRDVVAPPTFLIGFSTETGSAVLLDPELGLDYTYVVHGEQSFDLLGPVCAGDVLTAEVHVVRIEDAGRNELIELVTELRSPAHHVATARTTVVSRGTAAKVSV